MPDLPTREVLLRRLDLLSRKGSVAATKTLLDEMRREERDGKPKSKLDALDNVTPIRRNGAG